MNNINNEDKLDIIKNGKKEISLIKLIINPELFNERKTKILSEINYDYLLQLIKKEKEDVNLINFINYLNQNAIPVLKILINGFIEFDFKDENKEREILEIITKLIQFYFNKNIFYFIYKKLSKNYRRHVKLYNIKEIKKFEKLFKIWKILYDIKKYTNVYNYDISPIPFFINNKNENKNIIINLKQTIENTKYYNILIYFIPSSILDQNKNIPNFSFLKLFDDKNNSFEFKYNDLITKDNNIGIDSLSKVNNISFNLTKKEYDIYINNKNIKKNVEFNFNSILKMEILNNFIGEISNITIEKHTFITEENIPKKFKLSIKIEKNKSNGKINCDINLIKVFENNKNENIEGNLVHYNGEIFKNDYNPNYKYWKTSEKNLNEIEFFGGFESFIPMFKIIKYIIKELESNINNDEGMEEKYVKAYLDKSLEWIKDILKIIIRLIFLSEKNYIYFTNIIVPLIGSISEIYYILNQQDKNSKKIFKTLEQDLFTDKVFYDLFILIINSNVPNSIIDSYQKMFIKTNIENINFSLNYILFDINEIKHDKIDLYWYFLLLFNFILFILVYFDSKEKFENKNDLLNQLKSIQSYINNKKEKNNDETKFIKAVKPFIKLMSYFFSEKKDNKKKIFKNSQKLLNTNNYYYKLIINIIKTYLNANSFLRKNNIQSKEISHINSIKDLLEEEIFCDKKEKLLNETKINEIKNICKYYYKDKGFLQTLFPFLKEEYFLSEDELLLIDELIDYNGQYHHLMKELFIFNRLWANHKLFYANSLSKRKESNIKYKITNYYTTNFQRPIIYPILDYKYRYPNFSQFKINKKALYILKENEDDYNFDLYCPELDEIIYRYNKENTFLKIRDNNNIKIYRICLIKQLYHLKGFLFTIEKNNNFIICFYSNPYNFRIKKEGVETCNKDNCFELCYGSLFNCHNKERNKKILIKRDDIRFIMKKIYYYRKSAMEIFTETKSYYFNFYKEEDLDEFMNQFSNKINNIYYPIFNNNNLFGYIKLNEKIFKENQLNKEVDFIEIILNKLYNKNHQEISVFDALLLINLISNRSYVDLNQYLVFPLLFFYGKSNNIIKRDLKNHIGFQEINTESKLRKELLIQSFNEYRNSFAASEERNENYIFEKGCYFNTQYSNIVYTSNYMIRLIPFSFLAIELQGNNFDDPNRLFYSIKETLFNISKQKSDLRELIPEFFYLPEMFMNLSSFYFGRRTNNELVDDIIMTSNNEDINIINNGKKYLEYFVFIDKMRNLLEKRKNEINYWLNIIFGVEQKNITFKNGKNKIEAQYFRTEAYIDITQEKYKLYSKDDIIMKSVEFGVVPLQTIFTKLPDKKKKSNHDTIKDINQKEILLNNNENINKKDEKNNIYEFNDNNEINPFYYRDKYNLKFEIDKNNNMEKLKIYVNDKYKCEIIDHNDKIINVFYNPRLNMFATTSYDGLICIYIFPNKLFSIIKHSKNLFFDKVFLSSNPFPTIITFEKINNTISIYSLSGLLFKEIKLCEGKNDIEIIPIFYSNKGAYKDKIILKYEKEKYKIYNLPFFDEYKKL